MFWFHPGVWWLLAQSRLAREQLVDAEVVRLTSARKDYIASLLALAGIRLELDLAPAPLFLRKRHLTQRLHSLLEEVSMSKLRLVLSYAVMAALLAVAAWALFLSFPLASQAEVVAPQNAPPPPHPTTAFTGARWRRRRSARWSTRWSWRRAATASPATASTTAASSAKGE